MLLNCLRVQECDVTIRIAVCDNDPAMSAQHMVMTEFTDVLYFVETRPGVSPTRNALIEAVAQFSPWALVFIDDDETAKSDWLQALVDAADGYQADVVTGPVVYSLPITASAFARDSTFFDTLQRDDGIAVKNVATNNTLVLAAWFYAKPHLRFDDKYSLTGGGDVDFFLRLQAAGGTTAWAKYAIVHTEVTSARATRKWLIQRRVRDAQLGARLAISLKGASRSFTFLRGVRQLVIGFYRGRKDVHQIGSRSQRSEFAIASGIGLMRGAIGVYYYEYGSPAKRNQH